MPDHKTCTHSQKYCVRPDLPGSASNVSGKVQSHLCLTEWRGQEEVPVGQVNFRASLPRSENNVLQYMLHPDSYVDKTFL